jgi:hypothetical protein
MNYENEQVELYLCGRSTSIKSTAKFYFQY